ncbi:uncharacterized protein LOC112184899 [Rosa chinensis]|uniref:uncharacterized protein LOC112184899 n=1 Tax=Rosa chinensis TaxID=74649 RepID=UPI000D088DE5|nr:uncharacterized protein LOC112184899 [Rosa chinensis]
MGLHNYIRRYSVRDCVFDKSENLDIEETGREDDAQNGHGHVSREMEALRNNIASSLMGSPSQLPPQAAKAKTFASVLSCSIESTVNLSQLPIPVVHGSTPLKLYDLKASLASLWKISSPWHLVPLGKGYFDIHFNTEEDMRRIWGGGTCTLASGLFRLSQWQPDFKPVDALHQTHSQIWVRLYGLSQDYWHPQHLMEIARGVGTPLQLDRATKEREFGYFARVLVDVDMAGNLPSSLMVERETHCFPVDVVYENMCDNCGLVGHTIDRCKHLNKDTGDLLHSKGVVEGSKHAKPAIRQEYRVKSKPSVQQQVLSKEAVNSDVVIAKFVNQALVEVVDNKLGRIADLVVNEPMVNLEDGSSGGAVSPYVLNGNSFSLLADNDMEVIVDKSQEKSKQLVVAKVQNTTMVTTCNNINLDVSNVHTADDDASVDETDGERSAPSNPHSVLAQKTQFNSPQSGQSWHDMVEDDQLINQPEVSTGGVPPGFEHVGA